MRLVIGTPELWDVFDFEKRMVFNECVGYEIESAVKRYLNKVSTLTELICNRKNLTDRQFFNDLQNVFDVTLDNNDILNILSTSYKKKFIGFKTITTSMVSTVTHSEGFGHSFDWWEGDVQTIYKVAYTEDANITDRIYTVSDIKTLLKENRIVIVNEDVADCDNKLEKEEEYHHFKVINIENFLFESSQFYDASTKYIRSKIKTKKLMEYLGNYLDELLSEIDYLKGFLDSNDYLDRETATKCLKRLEEYGHLTKLETLNNGIQLLKEKSNVKEDDSKLVRRRALNNNGKKY